MKIANWNLERVLPAQKRFAEIRKHFKAIDADIWILTETHELVGPGVNFSSVMSGEREESATAGEHWAGIWSRHPINHLPSFVSDPVRCTASQIEHPKFGALVVYACVLPWSGSAWRGIKPAGGAAFAAALELYAGDWRRLRTAFPDAPLVVAGDFNQDLAQYHYYGSKEQRKLLESVLDENGMTALTGAANDPIEWGRKRRHACVDHICASEPLAVRAGKITRWPDAPQPDSRVSDHFGYAVDLL